MFMRQPYCFIAAIFWCALGFYSVAEGQYDLSRPIPGRAYRSSSADPDWAHGNGDYRPLPPGGKLVIADLNGPGVIDHLWFTFGDSNSQIWSGALRDLTLNFYWDNETTPSVRTPVGDFFALGNSQLAVVNSAMVQVGGPSKRGFNCYWRMPFHQHARLEIQNKSALNTMDKVYYHVDWIQYKTPLPGDMMHFHAQYRETTVTPGMDYVLADLHGKGTYVGTVLSLKNPNGFGEADENLFIDGELVPSISGTGSEDYFNQAWGFTTENTLYHGALTPLSDGSWSMYRWHIQDPIPFGQSLKFRWENWGFDGFTFGEMTWYFSSVAFWYQLDAPGPANRVELARWDSFR